MPKELHDLKVDIENMKANSLGFYRMSRRDVPHPTFFKTVLGWHSNDPNANREALTGNDTSSKSPLHIALVQTRRKNMFTEDTRSPQIRVIMEAVAALYNTSYLVVHHPDDGKENNGKLIDTFDSGKHKVDASNKAHAKALNFSKKNAGSVFVNKYDKTSKKLLHATEYRGGKKIKPPKKTKKARTLEELYRPERNDPYIQVPYDATVTTDGNKGKHDKKIEKEKEHKAKHNITVDSEDHDDDDTHHHSTIYYSNGDVGHHHTKKATKTVQRWKDVPNPRWRDPMKHMPMLRTSKNV